MTTPLTQALASLVAQAIPWIQFLDALGPRPPHTPAEAAEADRRDDQIAAAWISHQ